MKESTRNIILGILGLLFILNFIPGQGSKATNTQQALMASTVWSCNADSDCPKCLTSGLNVSWLSSDSKCVSGTCIGNDACIKWDCGTQNNCQSIRQTILDNIIDWASNHLWIMLGLIALGIAWWYLK